MPDMSALLARVVGPEMMQKAKWWNETHKVRGCGDGSENCWCKCDDHGCAIGHQDQWLCETCHDLHYVRLSVPLGHPTFGKAYECPTCKGGRLWADPRLLTTGLPWDRYAEFTLEAMDVKHNKVKAEVERWLALPAGDEPHLTIVGPVGTGKTRAVIGAAFQLAHEHRIITFIEVPALLDKLRAAIGHDEMSVADVLYPAMRSDVLILDDMGAEHATGWTEERLLGIVNARQKDRKPLIVTGNINPTDGAIRQTRLWSRLLGGEARVIHANGPDRRTVDIPNKSRKG